MRSQGAGQKRRSGHANSRSNSIIAGDPLTLSRIGAYAQVRGGAVLSVCHEVMRVDGDV